MDTALCDVIISCFYILLLIFLRLSKSLGFIFYHVISHSSNLSMTKIAYATKVFFKHYWLNLMIKVVFICFVRLLKVGPYSGWIVIPVAREGRLVSRTVL